MSDVKKIIGFVKGSFKNDDGEEISYVHLHCIGPDTTNGFVGLRGDKFKCRDDIVIADVYPGMYCNLYFDSKQKVVLIQPVEPTPEILKEFLEVIEE